MGRCSHPFFSMLLVGACIVDVFVVAGSHLGRRSDRRQAFARSSVEVSGLDILKTYVCPSSVADVKRQVQIASGSTTVSIPVSDLQALWEELSMLLVELAKILEEEGIAISSATASVPATVVDSVGSTSVITDVPIATVAPTSVDAVDVSQVATSTIVPFSTAPTPEISSSGNLVVSPFLTGSEAAPASTTAEAATLHITTSAPGAAASTDGGDELCYEDTTTIQSTLTVGRRDLANVVARGTAVASVAASSTAKAVATGITNGYVFDPESTRNVAVYLSQNPANLADQCAKADVDIVIIEAMVSSTSGSSQYPSIAFGSGCDGANMEMKLQAPGLVYCPRLASMINQCQSAYGKKVILSIGGASSHIKRRPSSQTTLMAPNNASDFVNVLWQLFGPTGSISSGLRPFGDVSVDGFDVDDDANLPANFDILATTLRTNIASGTDKYYYLSSTPHCASPVAAPLLICDFVFVQFTNKAACALGGTAFDTSISQWSSTLETSTLANRPRLYIGASPELHVTANEVASLGLPNLGGLILL